MIWIKNWRQGSEIMPEANVLIRRSGVPKPSVSPCGKIRNHTIKKIKADCLRLGWEEVFVLWIILPQLKKEDELGIILFWQSILSGHTSYSCEFSSFFAARVIFIPFDCNYVSNWFYFSPGWILLIQPDYSLVIIGMNKNLRNGIAIAWFKVGQWKMCHRSIFSCFEQFSDI